ncbi:hypothetical protein L596_020662 [Steinernema carpocapsae]|uniref:EF-hand domain-containing protein n=1 Tax=Steinernema carpocapsae TaxID=34508 RepID=A0A4U5MUZ4_STECR|nr:hypothetical protein L596_020662 [Steinernema carpocapsae]
MMKKFFDLYDTDGDGYFDWNDFERVLRKTGVRKRFSKSDIDEILAASDRNGDGKIDFAEYLNVDGHTVLHAIRWLFFEFDLKGEHFITRVKVESCLSKTDIELETTS